jgi:hypothetical protein
MDTVDEFLEHHGVRGQKWGIRHEPSKTGSSKTSSIQIDEKPWSNYKESDYTPAQWHNACLIHTHGSGIPKVKTLCKLPVKTPSGVVNRHGVFAAAGVLAGSRGGVNASINQKRKAANQLTRIYKQMGHEVPGSLTKVSAPLYLHKAGPLRWSNFETVEEFISHYGVRGMKWGIRHPEPRSGRSKSFKRTQYKKAPSRLSDEELHRRIKRMDLEKRYSELSTPQKSAGKKYAHDLLQNSGKTIVGSIIGTTVTFAISRALKARFG